MNTVLKLSVIVAAIIMSLTLLSSKITVNLNHKHKLGAVDTHRIATEKSIFKTVSHIRLSTEIEEPENYKDLLTLLDSAKEGDEIVFHLAGYGGRVDTTIQLINSMFNSKANITVIVEAPVYSAHALIALSGDNLVVKDGVLFMFHHTSALNSEDRCNKQEGKKDRGHDVKDKCLEYIKTHVQATREIIDKVLLKKLTSAEMILIYEGHDVYITGKDMRERI